LQQDEMRKMLRRALGQLPEREALVLQLYFVEELNVYEIAEILGVTTGRVSQIKKAAVGRLRESISAMEQE
jgi:RNA polymerase sigma factor for flagellar operon FliA